MKKSDLKNVYEKGPVDASREAYIRKLEAENDALKRQVGTDIALFDHIKDGIIALPRAERVSYPKPQLSHAETHAALFLADAHAEEYVSIREMEGFGHYDFDVFKSRMEMTTQKTLELVNIMRQASRVGVLDINNMGDWFVGQILPQEEAYGTTMPLPMAVPRVGIELGKLVVGLSAHFDKVRVNCLCGNHGRTTTKPSFKMTAERNWDMSVYLIAQGYAEQAKNVEWNIPHSIMDVVSVDGWNVLLTHSGEVAMTHRVPYYGIEDTFVKERQVRAGSEKDFSYAFTGHWHHHAFLNSNIVICPCMVGPNQFSRFKLHRKADPQQLLCFFTEKHGLVNQWPINL